MGITQNHTTVFICIIGISIVFSATGFPKLFHQQEKPFIPGTPDDVVEPVYKLILPGHISESSAVEKTYYDALSAIADSSEWEAVPEVEYLESLQEVCADAPGVFALCVFSDTQIPDPEQILDAIPNINLFVFREMPADIIDEEYLNTISPSEKNGYIGGLLASSMTRTNSIGFIGGMESKKSQSECAAFQDAVHSVNADTAIELAYAGSFSDSLKGAELARSMIGAESVDVIFSDASYVNIGVLKEIGQTASPCALVRVLSAAQESGPQDAAYALMDQILSQIKREVDLFQGKTFQLSVGDAFVGWVFRNSGAGQSSQ